MRDVVEELKYRIVEDYQARDADLSKPSLTTTLERLNELYFTLTDSEAKYVIHYYDCIWEGTSATLADMFASQRAPMSNTDRELLEGHCNGNQFANAPGVGDQYKRIAERAGVSTTGMVYMGGLGDYPGDPRAWVSGRGDIIRQCEQRGMDCDGSVKVRARRQTESPVITVADDIVDAKVQERLAADPGLAEKDRGELRHETKELLTPHWHKKG